VAPNGLQMTASLTSGFRVCCEIMHTKMINSNSLKAQLTKNLRFLSFSSFFTKILCELGPQVFWVSHSPLLPLPQIF